MALHDVQHDLTKAGMRHDLNERSGLRGERSMNARPCMRNISAARLGSMSLASVYLCGKGMSIN